MASFKRPTPRTGRGCYTLTRPLTPEELQRVLRSGPSRFRPPRPWVPSVDYELVARHLHPDSREAYIARCVEWFAANPPPPPRTAAVRESVDPEALSALIAKHGPHPPIEALRRMGYSETALKRVQQHRQWLEDHEDELEAEIERRWPGPSKPKPKKVIKAVKKKMH